ncbi:AraC family transcriptional regulator [Prosthecomicrobium pneumaticum]|uniref:AraC-like DNA-binding protein n=1 Tax=Prosthecomicrobium pneumaticum TaxID=81895 RepID=A0A7W9L3T7_9HYPH|nr:AraC family transcriptional regulator [Prosthecomicrobium pneumaticum]MBB5754883.1 AraC-like DNA-binding protein [Prosthecomicrobium pneumaticum]
MDELRSLIARHGPIGRTATAIPGVSLLRAEATTTAAPSVYQPLFCVVAQGAKRLLVGDRVLVYDEAKYIVVSVDMPVSGEIVAASPDAPYLAFSLALDRTALATMLIEMGGAEPEPPAPIGMAVSPVTPDLLDPVKRLMRLLDRPGEIAMLAPLAEREILYRLLTGPQGAMLRQIALADSRLSRVSRAIDWIRRHYDRPLRIEALAEVAGMSHSTFHRHFRAVTAMSPLQFQKHIRLQEARQLLLSRQGDAGAVGFAVGYESASQFSREYARLFGAPPARDAARLRGLSALDRARSAETV